MGVQIEQAPKALSGPLLIAALLYLALLIYAGVRMIMAAPAASAEEIGPIRIIMRSWVLSRGNFWRLLAFLLVFFIGAIILLMAIQSVVVLGVTLALGPVDPMSASALIVALVQALANAAISSLFAVMIARIYVQLAQGGAAQASVPSSGT
jgi:membrane-anchored glycerophosphoryl diester phosphodiesterase (GDPDase)